MLALTLAGGRAQAKTCLPRLFEDGQRLHDSYAPSLFDVSIILRQHEICSRPQRQPDDGNIALFGNSAVFGIDVRADQSFAGLLNASWETRNTPLHIYNLAFVFTYQLKDALILREALEYSPDLILYGITLADFHHLAPIPWPEAVVQFFSSNDAGIDRLAEEGAAGLNGLLEIYRARDDYRSELERQWTRLREAGSYLRLAVRHNAPAVVNRLLLSPEDDPVPPPDPPAESLLRRGSRYRCQKVIDEFNRFLGKQWSTWNVLAYLSQVQREREIDVVVFTLPIQHNPIGDCYNGRYPNRADAAFSKWIRTETESQGLELWDLSDLLPKSQFEDTIHPTELGHQKIAEELAGRIEAYLRTRPIRRTEE